MESYLIQSNIALVVFYLLYRLMIIRENNQQLKRFMGLCIVLFCASYMLIPSFDFAAAKDFPVVVQQALESASSIQSDFAYKAEKLSTWLVVYFIGVVIFTFRFLVGLAGIIKIYLRSQVSKKWGFVLIETNDPISPFSFFNLLFIKKGDAEKSGMAPIILHEKYHKDQMHSVDAMLLEILTILFWFNPVMWLLQKDIKATHEYLADDYVISRKGFDKLAYQDLLFKARTGISFKSVNYLSNQTSLKQRFNMMEKSKTHSKTSFIRAGIVLVAMATALFTSSFSSIYQSNDSQLDIRIFTSSGEVDLEKGVSKDTDKLFIRIVPKEGEDLKYRVSKTELTLVVGGVGRGTLRANEAIDLSGAGLKTLEEKSALVLEIKEYQTLNSENVVESYTPEKGIFFNIPVIR